MSTLDIACDLARRFEGCILSPYRDPVGFWTIGWGHLVTHDKTAPRPALDWTQAEADAALQSDMGQFVVGVRNLLTVKITDSGVGALSDFAFNLGLRSLRASTLLRLVNDGELAAAASEFPKWKFAGGRVLPGLIRRRVAERALFLS